VTAPRRPPTARAIAAQVLLRTAKEGAFAAAALDAEMERAPQLSPRDRALATELVYGTLRFLPWIDERIGARSTRPVARIDPLSRAHIELAAYQIFFLTRVPAFAAVNEAVTEVRAARGREVGAFVNAVLRRLADDASRSAVDPVEAAWVSTPAWLRTALARSFGDDGARAYVADAARVPPIGIRVLDAEERDAWIARLREAAKEASFEAGAASPLAILVRGAGRVTDLPGYAEGAWSIQEEGSQLVALALGARPGEVVLDACAGRGNKAAVLAAAVQPGGALDVADLHASKLERLAIELGRAGLAVRASHAVDWSIGTGGIDAVYDAVLVDAPCTGTGTLRRRPDLVLRRDEAGVSALADLQVAIAARVAERLRPGGRLVFATCSALREEGEDVTARLVARVPWLEPAPFAGEPAARLAGGLSELRLSPHIHGTDAYFLASFRRKE